MSKERWRRIPKHPEYAVSSWGRIVSFKFGKKRIKKGCPTMKGYVGIHVITKGVRKWFSVHRLVAIAFLPNPNNLPEVNHKDGNKANNCVDNLEWVTHLDNAKHASNMGLLITVFGEQHHNAKLNGAKVAAIRRRYATGQYTQKQLGDTYGVDGTIISDVVRRKIWKHIP